MRPLATLLGRGDVIPPDYIFDALLRLNDELAAVRQLLGDPAVTSVRLVLTPEAVVAAEARRTFTALALYGYAVDLVVANRVFPAGDDAWRQGWARGPAGAAGRHPRVLRRAARARAGVPCRPSRSAPTRCARWPTRSTARCPATTRARGAGHASCCTVESDGEGFVLRMALPLAERGRGRRRAGRRRARRHRRRAPAGADPAERAAPVRRGRRRVRRDG